MNFCSTFCKKWWYLYVIASGELRGAFFAVWDGGVRCAFDQATKTLLVTDMVVKVEDAVPPIVAEDPRCLLFHARDNALEKVENTEEVRLKGWRRIVQVGGLFEAVCSECLIRRGDPSDLLKIISGLFEVFCSKWSIRSVISVVVYSKWSIQSGLFEVVYLKWYF